MKRRFENPPASVPAGDQVQAHYASLASEYDAKANQTCKRAYQDLVRRYLGGAGRVLEIGAGSSSLLNPRAGRFSVACDFSCAMLASGGGGDGLARVAADAQRLPFAADSFDAVFSINLLEHVPRPRAVFEEAARLLAPGGRFLAVTPSGDAAGLLELLERLHLKLPEGPHRFLRYSELNGLAGAPDGPWRVLEHRRFLACPAGPLPWVYAVDRLFPFPHGWGLFQYLVAELKE